MAITRAIAIEQAGAISTALNDAIDNGVLKKDLRPAYSLRSHFTGILKEGTTPSGKPGFSVDDTAINTKY